jgi:ATP-dependent RNA helicase RhlE
MRPINWIFDLTENIVTFSSYGLPAPILKGIRAAGLTEPTAIQSRAIPIILQGNDLIGMAQSGSGKSGAYLLPVLSRFLDRSTRLRGIILVPTRELAAYVETRARDFARYTELKVGVVFTGAPIQAQERLLLEQNINLLVATPGRLLELHALGCLNFADVEVLVLEEADRMVALGLAPDLRKLLKLLPETRQTLMFTLTVPPELNRLAKEALVEPVRVDLAPPGKPAAAGITQAIYPVARELKSALLDDMLARAEVRSTIVLTRSRTGGERVARQLQRRGYAVAVLDEHPNQGARESALEDLRRGRVQILVASDASARSLDVAGTAHVVNYDVPQTPEDYVHRLGRAGRADPVGDAFTLMSPEEQKYVAAIERLLGRAIPRVMLPDFDYGPQAREIKLVTAYAEKEAMPQERIERAAPEVGLHAAATAIATLERMSPPGNGAATDVLTSRPQTIEKPRKANGKSHRPVRRASKLVKSGRAHSTRLIKGVSSSKRPKVQAGRKKIR